MAPYSCLSTPPCLPSQAGRQLTSLTCVSHQETQTGACHRSQTCYQGRWYTEPQTADRPRGWGTGGYSELWEAKRGQFYGRQAKYLIVSDVPTPPLGRAVLSAGPEWWGEEVCLREEVKETEPNLTSLLPQPLTQIAVSSISISPMPRKGWPMVSSHICLLDKCLDLGPRELAQSITPPGDHLS